MTDIERIKELTQLLNHYRNEYYNNANSEISDYEYDRLFDELKLKEDETGFCLANSPTRTVGYTVQSRLQKSVHDYPMLSLDKTKSSDAIVKFVENRKALVMLKLDGCFTGNTKISMYDGSIKKIKDIKEGDLVLSFDENTNKICSGRVKKKYLNGLKPFEVWNRLILYDKDLNGNTVTCTNNHKFYTKSGFIKSGDLNIGDSVYVYNRSISRNQKSILLGMLLGDGHFVNRNIKSKKPKLEIHYAKTKNNDDDTILHKINQCFSFCNGKISNTTSGYSKYKDNMTLLNLHVMNVPDYLYDKQNQLRCGITFTEDICKKLSPLALAIYYLDDGSKIQCKNDGCDVFSIKNSCLLHTNRHKLENVQILSDYLNFIGISNNIRLEKECKNQEYGDGYIIYIDTFGTEKFFDMISKYIPKQFRERKLGLKNKWQNCEEVQWWEDDSFEELVETKIIDKTNGCDIWKSQAGRNYRRESYDLEIDETHTYFANGFAVHNCTAAITYKNGKMSKAETRGDGSIGEDITENARTFSNLPLEIPYKGKLVVFGEAIIDYQTFNNINKNLPEESKYKNPRNLCSGTVRQLDSKVCAERNVRFIAWRLVEGSESSSFIKRLDELDVYGFTTVGRVLFAKEIIDIQLERAKEKAEERGIPIDGCVISFDDVTYGESLGMTGHHLRSQIAFKYDEDRETTVLHDIEWSAGKTGVFTPVGIFDSVELAGTTVSRASLHNISIMKDLNIRVGAEVTVVKKNEIIPQIIECDSESPEFIIPDYCPVCGNRTQIVKENDTEVLMCTNENCKGKLLGKLTHFVSKSATNIDGLSESTLEKFIELGWLNSFKDIYFLKNYVSEMSTMSGFGKKSVKKLMESIEKSRSITLDRFINALSIPLIGRTASKDIAKACQWDFNNFRTIIDLEAENAFIGIAGFGKEMNRSLCNWWCENKKMAVELAGLFIFEEPNKSIINKTDLSGKVFVITGSLEHFANRDELKERIDSMGGKVSGTVSAKISYLINNDVNSASGKNKKAHELGIPIISEEELLKMLIS